MLFAGSKGEEMTTSGIYLDDFKVTVADVIEVQAGERRTLVAGEHIRIEPIGSQENSVERLANAHFQHLESEMSRRACVLVLRSNSSSNYSLTDFTYKDITNGLIMLSVS